MHVYQTCSMHSPQTKDYVDEVEPFLNRKAPQPINTSPLSTSRTYVHNLSLTTDCTQESFFFSDRCSIMQGNEVSRAATTRVGNVSARTWVGIRNPRSAYLNPNGSFVARAVSLTAAFSPLFYLNNPRKHWITCASIGSQIVVSPRSTSCQVFWKDLCRRYHS